LQFGQRCMDGLDRPFPQFKQPWITEFVVSNRFARIRVPIGNSVM
jgi:hypothetical protein